MEQWHPFFHPPSVTVKEAFKKAKGGLLFIDEAHRLGIDERASKQVIGTLLTEVEAQLGTVQVVLAGYPDAISVEVHVPIIVLGAPRRVIT